MNQNELILILVCHCLPSHISNYTSLDWSNEQYNYYELSIILYIYYYNTH